MDLHQRQPLINHHVHGICQTIGIMGECRRIHHNRSLFVGGLMHPADHFSFIVALTDFHVKTKLLTPLRAQATQGFKILLAIHVGLTHAKASEVRSIDDYYFSHVQLPCYYC